MFIKKQLLRTSLLLSLVASVAVLSACSLLTPTEYARPAPLYSSKETQRIESLEADLADALIANEKIKAQSESGGGQLPDMPENAETGRCYARMLAPPEYIDRIEKRMIKEASERVDIKPAKLAWFDEQVVVKEERLQLSVVPATYKWVNERTEVLPERSRQVLVRVAEYQTIVESVLSTPEERVWKPGRGGVEKINEETGEIVHLVMVPAQYRSIEKQFLKSPAQYQKVIDPAEFEVVRKRVVDVPEHTITERVPAVYKTVKVQRIVEPEEEIREPIEAEYKDFGYREKTQDARLEWRMIPCAKELNKERIYKVQRALRALEYDTGGVDGVLGTYTQKAINDYQKAKGLATSRLSIETLEALGIE